MHHSTKWKTAQQRLQRNNHYKHTHHLARNAQAMAHVIPSQTAKFHDRAIKHVIRGCCKVTRPFCLNHNGGKHGIAEIGPMYDTAGNIALLAVLPLHQDISLRFSSVALNATKNLISCSSYGMSRKWTLYLHICKSICSTFEQFKQAL